MTTPIERRTFLMGVGGFAGAILLGGACNPGRQGAVGGRPTVRVRSWVDLGDPSPFSYIAGPGYWRMSLLFDTLTWPDSTGKQLPWLASSYKRSDDGLVWSLDLRDVKFSDGTPMTPRDVVFTYQYYTSQTFTPLLTGVPKKGAEVRETGPKSVEFRLKSPDATFLQQVLGTMPIVSERIFSKVSDPMGDHGPETYIGTGAYTLASRNLDAQTESYAARDDYYLGKPFVRRVEQVLVSGDIIDELPALLAGELDGAGSQAEGVRNEVLNPIRANPEFGMISLDAGFGMPMFFDTRKGGGLADLRFRRAVLHAIDRNDICQRLFTGNAQVGSAGWLPPSNEYYTPTGIKDYPFDRTEAERLLDEGGYRRTSPGAPRVNPDGSPLRYTLTMPTTIPLAVAEFVKASLEAVGVGVSEVRRLELPRVFGAKLSGYELLIQTFPGPAGIGPPGDPDQLRGVYYSNPPNQTHKATGYANPEVDRLLDIQVAALDIAERKKAVAQIQRIVSEDLPVAMLYYTKFFYAFKKKVFDAWYYTPGGFSSGVFDVYNKQSYITGQKTGTTIKST